MLDVRKLRMLATLERLGTIAAVAEEMHLTAPGVSMQINAFERELGVAITERQGRRVVLTPAGRVLATHGRDILDRLSLAQLDVDALKSGVAGHYRVGAFPSAARTIVADAWSGLASQHPGLTLSVSTPEPEAALADLAAGNTDLAVIHSYSNIPRELPNGVHAERVAAEPVLVALRRDDEQAGSEVGLAVLAERPWATPPHDLTCFEMTERACGLAGFRPRVIAESADFTVLLALVSAGLAVALVPELAASALPANVTMARTRPALQRNVFAVRRSSTTGDESLNTIVESLADAARRRLGAPAPGRPPTCEGTR